MKIRTVPDTILRKKACAVARVTDAERRLLAEMAEAMYLSQGVGLAAVQVGIDQQLAVIDIGGGLVKLINPVIVKKEGREKQEEGCLSVPKVLIKVGRAKKVVVAFLNERGEAARLTAEGLFARAIQHEVDHLAGKLIIDYANPLKRLLLKKKRRP